MDDLQKELRQAREEAGLSPKEAASLLEVSEVTQRRWEGQSGRGTTIPFAYWEFFLLKTGKHPTHEIREKT